MPLPLYALIPGAVLLLIGVAVLLSHLLAKNPSGNDWRRLLIGCGSLLAAYLVPMAITAAY